MPLSGYLNARSVPYPPEASTQQNQIVIYGPRDVHNEWLLVPYTSLLLEDQSLPNPAWLSNITILRHGDKIRLFNEVTRKFLHSHPLPAFVDAHHYQVTGYGDWNHYDPNDCWIVEIVDDVGASPPLTDGRIRTLTTRFRLKHCETGCYLGGERSLPSWAFRLREVTCNPSKDAVQDEKVWWMVEKHVDNRRKQPNYFIFKMIACLGENAELQQFKRSFFRAIIRLNIANWKDNFNLGDFNACSVCSTPEKWPFLLQGFQMTAFTDDITKIYLLGNPLVWWISVLAYLVSVAIGLFTLRSRSVCNYL